VVNECDGLFADHQPIPRRVYGNRSGSWGTGSNRAEIYSKERVSSLPGVLFGSELAKIPESSVKFLRERPMSCKIRIQRAAFHAANRGSIVGDNFA
jgi:hypothetical protein